MCGERFAGKRCEQLGVKTAALNTDPRGCLLSLRPDPSKNRILETRPPIEFHDQVNFNFKPAAATIAPTTSEILSPQCLGLIINVFCFG